MWSRSAVCKRHFVLPRWQWPGLVPYSLSGPTDKVRLGVLPGASSIASSAGTPTRRVAASVSGAQSHCPNPQRSLDYRPTRVPKGSEVFGPRDREGTTLRRSRLWRLLLERSWYPGRKKDAAGVVCWATTHDDGIGFAEERDSLGAGLEVLSSGPDFKLNPSAQGSITAPLRLRHWWPRSGHQARTRR